MLCRNIQDALSQRAHRCMKRCDGQCPRWLWLGARPTCWRTDREFEDRSQLMLAVNVRFRECGLTLWGTACKEGGAIKNRGDE